MAKSPLALMQWFEAIRWILWQPTITADELAQNLGLQRMATVRKMAAKVRAAMADDQATQKLAGLDKYFARPSSSLSQAPLRELN